MSIQSAEAVPMRWVLLLVFLFITLGLTDAYGQTDEEIEAAAQKAVHAYSLSGIQVSVQSGTITLTGFVGVAGDTAVTKGIKAGTS
jgi:hypothetical protein